MSSLENVHVVVLVILNGVDVLTEVSAYCVGYWYVRRLDGHFCGDGLKRAGGSQGGQVGEEKDSRSPRELSDLGKEALGTLLDLQAAEQSPLRWEFWEAGLI